MLEYLHKVQYYETDKMGITHHSNYIRWMEEARVDFLDTIGWGYDKLEEEGIVSPVVAAGCTYKKTTTFHDVISISLKVKEYNGIKLKLQYEMKNKETQEVVAIGDTEHCFLDKKGRFVSLKKQLPLFDEMLKNS